MPARQPNGATRSIDGLRVPIAAPIGGDETEKFQSVENQLQDVLDGIPEGTPFERSFGAFVDDLTALRCGVSPERAEHYRRAWALGEVEESLRDEYQKALRGSDGNVKPLSLSELRAKRRLWETDTEQFQRWLDRAECLLDREENR